jgi:hypothetical protein
MTEVPVHQYPMIGAAVAPPDHSIVIDERGLPVAVPITGPPVERGGTMWPSAWHADAYVRDIKRELDGIEARLSRVDEDDLLPWQEPRTAEQKARDRTSLEGTRDFILAELERMGEQDSQDSPKRGRRRGR